MSRRNYFCISGSFSFFFSVSKVELGIGNHQAQKYTFSVLLSWWGCEPVGYSRARLGLASGHGAGQHCVGLAAPGRWWSWPGGKCFQSIQLCPGLYQALGVGWGVQSYE